MAARCSSNGRGNAAKRHYRYYACARRAEDRSCAQPYVPAARLEGAGIRPFLNREIRQRRAGRQDLARRAAVLDREITDLDSRQREMVNWLAETMPGKVAARKLNEKIETLEQERNALAEERAALRSRLAAGDLTGVTAESVAGHLARFRDYFDRFNAGQRKELVEAVVRAVTVEGPARARVRFSLPIEPLGRFDRGLESDPVGGSKYRVVWWPQRDSNPCFSLERATS